MTPTQGAEAFDAATKAYDALAEELREVSASREECLVALGGAERALTVAVRQATRDMPDFDPGEHHVIKAARAAIAKARRSP